LNRFAGVESNCIGKSKKLDDVDLPLSSFDRGDKGLIPAELLRIFYLSQARPFPFHNEEGLQGLVP
jgi:hypothetical protein